MRSVEILGIRIEPDSGAPVVFLREAEAPHRVLPVFVGPAEATAIAMALSGAAPSRPLTHDLLASLLTSLDASVERIEVTALENATFLAALELHGPSGNRRVDARPSDAIAVALRTHAPLFVSDAVMDEAGVELIDEDEVPEDSAFDEATIESEVDEFRDFLADLTPADFLEPETIDDLPGGDDDEPIDLLDLEPIDDTPRDLGTVEGDG